MKINFNNNVLKSFKGRCTIGKDRVQKILIADNILKNSKDIEEARKKASQINKTAMLTARYTPDDMDLYIDFPPCQKNRGIMSILPYSQSIALYSKKGGKDECIANDCLNLMKPNTDEFDIKILTKKLFSQLVEYCRNPKTEINSNAIPKTACFEAIEPVLELIV